MVLSIMLIPDVCFVFLPIFAEENWMENRNTLKYIFMWTSFSGNCVFYYLKLFCKNCIFFTYRRIGLNL